MTPVPSETRRIHIYEVSNRTRLESLLVLTFAGAKEILAQLRVAPPAEAEAWSLSDDVALDILAQHMSETSAEEFLKMHLEHMQRRTWRFKVWRV